ncbi:MAG: hypothetical protein HYV09_38520 [Deltaproteobacteria bacterium]|nr:hypothetical protein [Deltaproteobacteria bacterium]
MRRRAFFVLASLTLGCSGSSGEVAEGAADTLDDATTGDVSVDTGDASIDPGDVSADTGDGFVPCKTDGECASSTAGKACDVASGNCVPCTATSDVCAPSEHCDPAAMKCVSGCKADEGCAPATGDAGADAEDADDAAEGGASTKPRCDVATHTCVECTKDDHCAPGYLCVGNVCSKGCSSSKPCPTGETCCTGACVDVASNLDHCGKCGEKCSVTSGSAKCEAGACAVASCSGTLADCDKDYSNGCEVDTATSLTSCGACGTNCEPAHATGAACTSSTCGYGACESPWADCDGNAANGCEWSVASDTANCGSCGNACPAVANATSTCSSGTCGFTCLTGFADCDGNAANGCEVNLTSDVAHCGTCGKVCTVANGTPACVGGACGIAACSGPFRDCNSSVSDGCEVDTASSTSHCGGCGAACALANATATCSSGACAIASCKPSFADCDGNVANGCEVDVQSSMANCGSCGRPCLPMPHSTAACTSGTCGLGSCIGWYRDCNDYWLDGCEKSTASDPYNCGACGNACGYEGVCNDGRCRYPIDCQALRDIRPLSASGAYKIDPDGVGPTSPFKAWCEMIGSEGWTLALKLDGTKTTFAYDSGYWTSGVLINPGSADLSLTEAKLAPFTMLPFSQLRLGMRDGGVDRWITVNVAGTSLQSYFTTTTGFLATGAGRTAWRSLLAAPTLQPNCGREGFNNAVAGYARVRIGILANGENDCDTPDSFIGFGAGPVACLGGATPVTTGNVGSCGSAEGDRSTATFGWVFVR